METAAKQACTEKDDMQQRIGTLVLKIMFATLFGIVGAIGGAIGGAIFGTVFGVADAWMRGAAFGAIFGGILVLYATIVAAIRYWRTERRRSSRHAKGPSV
jgi:hypothetical protein